jgi:UTP--glucose-1-phosphate uridylyltransferase
LTDGIAILAKLERVLAYHFIGDRYDIGEKLGFIKSTIEFALNREDLHLEMKKYLKEKSRQLMTEVTNL